MKKKFEFSFKKYMKFVCIAILSSAMLVSCDSDDGEDNIPGSDFNRKAMLESVGTDLIVPNFEDLQSSVNTLSVAANGFTQNTNEENLIAMRTAWRQAVIDHQHCSAFGFGPGELLLGPYANVLGVFPVNEEKIEINVLNPDFDLPNSFDRDVRGFYAVEYLIYGNGLTDAEIVTSFDQNRKDYLLLIVSELKSSFDGIVAEWNDFYLQSFINSDGTSAGSSISLYYNAFIKDYENIKNFKVELPAGLSAGQPTADGSLVEAYYSGISSELIAAHFENSKNIWFGRSRSGMELIGFEEYLQSVIGGPALVQTTTEAIFEIDEAIANLPEGSLSENITSQDVEVLRNELQSNTSNFKSSMSSLLGISITFNSGDGD
ncbi:MAG: imelysin family protein [Cryomorphaceae bacterium]